MDKLKNRKLKSWVLPSIYIMTMAVIFLGVNFIIKNLNTNYTNYKFSTKVVDNNDLPVISTNDNEVILKPFNSPDVSIYKTYYKMDDTEENQQKSLIFYQDTYMENTGVLYESENNFDVVSVLDGKVKKIGKDELLGNYILIEHSPNFVTAYYNLGNILVKEEESILQGQSISSVCQSNINESGKYTLLFEVYNKGVLMNPDEFYNMNVKDVYN